MIEGGLDFMENKRVDGAAPADHEGITVGFFEHAVGIVGSEDIAVANDGDAEDRFGISDELPLGGRAVAVEFGAGMEGEEPDAAFLCGQEVFLEEGKIFKAGAHFDGDGDLDGADEGLGHEVELFGVFEEGRAGSFSDDGVGGTAAVEVDAMGAFPFELLSHFGDEVGLGSHDLSGKGDGRELGGVVVFGKAGDVGVSGDADKFCDGFIKTSDGGHRFAERAVADAFHGGEEKIGAAVGVWG